MSIRLTLAPIAMACAVLSACGSGSSEAPAASDAPADLIVAGSAATGAAMPKASIAIRCAAGTGSATTSVDGSYSATIRGGQLPCAIRAISEDGSLTLHSALEGTGSGAVTANVTPMSELIVAQAQGTSAALMFDQFEDNKIKLTPAALAEAKSRVKEALASIVDLSGTDPIKDVLVPAVEGKSGNDLDQKLDALRDRLVEAGMKIQELGDVLTANADDTARHVVGSTVARRSLACKSVRSGTYRLILAGRSSAVSEFDLDASSLMVTAAGVTEQWTADACTLSSPSGMKLVFGAQGLGAVRASDNSVGVVMPKQNLGLGFVAGSWSWVRRHVETAATSSAGVSNLVVKASTGGSTGGGFSVPVSPVIVPVVVPASSVSWGETRFSAAGDTLASTQCDSAACLSLPVAELKTLAKMTRASDGGFIAADGARLYVFRAAGGASVMVRLAAVGGDSADLSIGRRGPALGVPRVGSSFTLTGLSISSLGAVSSDFTSESYTIKANDRRDRTFSRLRSSDCQVDSWTLRRPFAQMIERVAGTSASCADTSPTALALSDVKAISDQGLGFSASVSPSQRSMMFTVTAPKSEAQGRDDDNENDDKDDNDD